MSRLGKLKKEAINEANKRVLNEQEDVLGDIYDAEKHFSQYGYEIVGSRPENMILQKYCGNAVSTIEIDGWKPAGAGRISVSLELDDGSHPSGQEVKRGSSRDATLKEIEAAIAYGFNKYSFAIKDCDNIFTSLP